jgi:hypothetical protein
MAAAAKKASRDPRATARFLIDDLLMEGCEGKLRAGSAAGRTALGPDGFETPDPGAAATEDPSCEDAPSGDSEARV